MKMIRIPKRVFTSGCKPFSQLPLPKGYPRFPEYYERCTLAVEEFLLAAYPVSEIQYRLFTLDTQRKFGYTEKRPGISNKPVTNVCSESVRAYIKWLNNKTGKKYRLPTNAELECGSKAATDTRYPWGDHIGKNNMNCVGSQYQKYHGKNKSPVGIFPPNPYGLYDMNGNVWEMCTLFHEEPSSRNIFLVVRGGSFNSSPYFLMSSAYRQNAPLHGHKEVGFRLAMDVEPT